MKILKFYKNKVILAYKKHKLQRYYNTPLEPVIDMQMIEYKKKIVNEKTIDNAIIYDGKIESNHLDPLNSDLKGEYFDSNIYQSSNIDAINDSYNKEEKISSTIDKMIHDLDSWEIGLEFKKHFLHDEFLKESQNEKVFIKIVNNQKEILNIVKSRDNIFDLTDRSIEELRNELFKIASNKIETNNKLFQREIKLIPRRKNIDPIATLKKGIARNGGYFKGFYYKQSPSVVNRIIKPYDLLIIGDVSGSMGRYIVIVLYLISTLNKYARVNSYIFSDNVTFASPYLKGRSFRVQYENIKKNAISWEYGTRICKALHQVNQEQKYISSTDVLIITDGGFSLINDDWEETVENIIKLKKNVKRIFVLTPNNELVDEGSLLSSKLWNVENIPRKGNELNTPELQKIARYGLLTRYSDKTLYCVSPEDVINTINMLLE